MVTGLEHDRSSLPPACMTRTHPLAPSLLDHFVRNPVVLGLLTTLTSPKPASTLNNFNVPKTHLNVHAKTRAYLYPL
jgi:hypothetical protein